MPVFKESLLTQKQFFAIFAALFFYLSQPKGNIS